MSMAVKRMINPRKAWLTVETHEGIQWAMLHRTGVIRYAVSIPEGEMQHFFKALVNEFGKKRAK